MTRFLAVRTAAAAGLLLVLSAIIFLLQTVSPGDPVRASLGANASPAAVAALRAKLGLDDPFLLRYAHFLRGLAHGDLGTSLRTHRAVTTDLRDFVPATTELVLAAFVLALLLGTLFAVSGALAWPGGALFRGILLVGATAPPFLLALGGVILFYAHLGWLPATGRGEDGASGFVLVKSVLTLDAGALGAGLRHVLLPALVLSIAPALSIGRILRASLEVTLATDHVRTARSKGLGEPRVLARHVVRNALGPGLSMAGLQLGFMFAGVVVVEQIFSWPGIGNYLSSSIPVSDFPAIAGVTLLLGAVYVVVNAVVDVLQALADPRLNA